MTKKADTNQTQAYNYGFANGPNILIVKAPDVRNSHHLSHLSGPHFKQCC